MSQAACASPSSSDTQPQHLPLRLSGLERVSVVQALHRCHPIQCTQGGQRRGAGGRTLVPITSQAGHRQLLYALERRYKCCH